jgi:hypothetical protein
MCLSWPKAMGDTFNNFVISIICPSSFLRTSTVVFLLSFYSCCGDSISIRSMWIGTRGGGRVCIRSMLHRWRRTVRNGPVRGCAVAAQKRDVALFCLSLCEKCVQVCVGTFTSQVTRRWLLVDKRTLLWNASSDSWNNMALRRRAISSPRGRETLMFGECSRCASLRRLYAVCSNPKYHQQTVVEDI